MAAEMETPHHVEGKTATPHHVGRGRGLISCPKKKTGRSGKLGAAEGEEEEVEYEDHHFVLDLRDIFEPRRVDWRERVLAAMNRAMDRVLAAMLRVAALAWKVFGLAFTVLALAWMFLALAWNVLALAWKQLPRPSSSSPRPNPKEPVDYPDYEMLAEITRNTPLWSEEALAAERHLVLKALELYNAMHPGNEYELAPGEVIRSSEPADNCVWTHGNFVARRRKRSGYFSFLPAPPTLFFFERVSRADFQGAVTCIRLDEPVTQAFRFLGFSLGWGTRRVGRSDCVCKTCYRRFDVLYRCLMKTCACGQKVEAVCEMCYGCSDVLHPHRGEFEFGYRK